MAKVDVGNLTEEETIAALVEILHYLPSYIARDTIVDSLDQNDLEELEIACKDKIAELSEAEDEDEEENDDEENGEL